jgi:hypothetical protein
MNLQEQINRIQEMMGIINESSLDDMIKDFGDEVRLRKFMTSEEIKMANKLVKKGLMEKGTSDEKKSSVTYYVDSSIYRRL